MQWLTFRFLWLSTLWQKWKNQSIQTADKKWPWKLEYITLNLRLHGSLVSSLMVPALIAFIFRLCLTQKNNTDNQKTLQCSTTTQVQADVWGNSWDIFAEWFSISLFMNRNPELGLHFYINDTPVKIPNCFVGDWQKSVHRQKYKHLAKYSGLLFK